MRRRARIAREICMCTMMARNKLNQVALTGEEATDGKNRVENF